MDEHLAYAYLSAAVDFDISQVVDIVCGVHARIREADFDGPAAVAAAHATTTGFDAVGGAFDGSVWRTVGDPLYQGAWDGPLAGLTVAVKDVFAIKGYRVGAGNPTFLDGARPETRTAPAVGDLLRGGASLRGIARTDEFAYSIAGDNVHYGTPPNRGRCPAARRAVPPRLSRSATPTSASRPTPPGPSASPPRIKGCGGCERRTTSCRARGCCRSRSPSIPWRGSPGTAIRCAASRTGASATTDRSRPRASTVRRPKTCRGASSCRGRRWPWSNPRRARCSSGCSPSSRPLTNRPRSTACRSATSTTTPCPSAPCRVRRPGATPATGCVSTRAPSDPPSPSASAPRR